MRTRCNIQFPKSQYALYVANFHPWVQRNTHSVGVRGSYLAGHQSYKGVAVHSWREATKSQQRKRSLSRVHHKLSELAKPTDYEEK